METHRTYNKDITCNDHLFNQHPFTLSIIIMLSPAGYNNVANMLKLTSMIVTVNIIIIYL